MFDHTVTIEPDLYERVQDVAQERRTSVDKLFAQAARCYLWELDRRKISAESRIYRQRHAELKARYLGQYIAMHNGQVIDHDPDFQPLYRRIRQRFGRTPVMITRVEGTADRPLVRHGFRLEMAGKYPL